MKNSIFAIIAALGIGFTSASTQAVELCDCYFDGDTPESGATLQKNPKISLGGESCTVFQLSVETGDGEYEVIPRAMGVFEWQQCRFSNVITDSKIEDHLIGVAQDGMVTIRGECGVIIPPEDDDSPAPDPDGSFESYGCFAERSFKVE
jgi:hypothetical protein